MALKPNSAERGGGASTPEEPKLQAGLRFVAIRTGRSQLTTDASGFREPLKLSEADLCTSVMQIACKTARNVVARSHKSDCASEKHPKFPYFENRPELRITAPRRRGRRTEVSGPGRVRLRDTGCANEGSGFLTCSQSEDGVNPSRHSEKPSMMPTHQGPSS
jgi:hypothetical protein